MDTFYMKKGDTKRPLHCRLKNKDGSIVNLTGCTVLFRMEKQGVIFECESQIVDAVDGQVWYVFSQEQTFEGYYRGYFVVTYDDFNTETFPADRHIPIIIN